MNLYIQFPKNDEDFMAHLEKMDLEDDVSSTDNGLYLQPYDTYDDLIEHLKEYDGNSSCYGTFVEDDEDFQRYAFAYLKGESAIIHPCNDDRFLVVILHDDGTLDEKSMAEARNLIALRAKIEAGA